MELTYKKTVAVLCTTLATIMLYGRTTTARTIQKKPIAVVYTQESILLHKEQYVPVGVGARMRHATCTAAAWFHNNYLVSLNLYGEKMVVYYFDEKTKQFSIVQEINNAQGAMLRHPEHLSVHPSGTLLAVCNATNPSVNIYAIDQETHVINPVPLCSVSGNDLIHNTRFTPDGNYMAYASFDARKSLCMYKIVRDQNDVRLEQTYQRANDLKLVRAKAIQFTQNNTYAIVAYALPISLTMHSPFKNILVSYKRNANGSLGRAVSHVHGTFSTEDVVLFDNDHSVVVTDQGNDMLIAYPFDPNTGKFSKNYTVIENPEAQLSFPHGMSLSPDGNYLVVCNYGDDTFNLYQIN